MSEAARPYRVSYTGLVRAEVRRLIETAEPERAQAIIAAVKELDRLLRIYPQFGEPEVDLIQETGQVYNGTVPPLVVRYAVLEERRLVFVSSPPKLLPNPG